MARIKKFAGDIPQGLSAIQTFLVDENPNSDYFRITEFKETFTGGKNGFLIEGSPYLKETTEVKIEILDVEGNTVYYEPGDGIPEYYEGISKVVSVYIYEDTPIGLGKITILGELKQYLDTGGVLRDIPEEWKGLYNVKWEREFKINKNLTNEDKVRFYRRPTVSITEISRPIFNLTPVSVTQTGNVLGTPLVPAPGTNITTFPRPSQYLLTTLDDTRWTGSVVNSTVEVEGQSLIPLEVVSDTELIVSTPYTENNIVTSFNNKSYSTTFNYFTSDGLGTALSGSFGKFVITNLETFVGDVYRIKVFRTSQSDLTDFQFVQEIVLESTEILIDYEQSQRDEESYGLFTPFILDEYWELSSANITKEFNQSFLFNSVKLNSTGENTFSTIQNVSISNGIEYTLSFNTRIPEVTSGDFIEVYLQGTKNGTTRTQSIATINSSSELLQKSNQTFNFIGGDFDDSKLYFKVKGNNWYISTVSLRAAQESAFSPDEITFIQTVPRTLEQETFDFRFEFYDINNNYIPVEVTATKTFSAGNLNEIQKSIEIVATSLYFQFDSGSQQGNALPPKAIFFDINKQFLTGSTNFTSGAYDNNNNLLDSAQYSSTFYPGLLEEISEDRYRLTVESFSGSIYDNVVQYITYTAECEGVTDNITISRLADGKGGVNFDIRPFRGSVIRNSDPTSSVEIQAVRIDGINETNLRAGLPLDYSVPLLYVVSSSLEGTTSYVTLEEASSSGYIIGLTSGTTGSGEINYNAEFNRDAINGQITVYLIPSTSPTSESILTSLTLTDLQDGLNTGEILYDVDTFGINPYVSFQNTSFDRVFNPVKSSVTGSFFRRGQTESPVSGTLDIYPSMSINSDFVPSFWLYYETGSFNEDVTVLVKNESGVEIQPTGSGTFSGSFDNQNKQLSVIFTYSEPFTTASVSVEKTFTIVPEGKPGDDAITIEFEPRSVSLNANESRVVSDYSPSIAEIRVRQGNSESDGYLTYQATRSPGTFYINADNITSTNISFLGFDSNDEGSTTVVTAEARDMTDLEGTSKASITFPIEIRPYFTSSYYTTSVSQSFVRVDNGAAGRSVVLRADSSTVTYNGDGNVVSPAGSITLTATAFNTTSSNDVNFFFYKDDAFIDVVNQFGATTITKEVPSSEFPAGGISQTYRVDLHDGNNDINATPNAAASVTITGIQDGTPNYQAVVTNQNATMFVDVYENKVMDNTSTAIEAYKGQTKLTHKGSGESYSSPTFDDLGNVIPNAEYRVSIHSFPSDYIDISGSLVSGSILPTDADGNAFLGPLDDWTNFRNADGTPNSASANIVFRVDFEDGRDSTLVRQNLSVGYEGNIGPGLIMRGEWTGSIDYVFDVAAKRRDAVFREISGDVHYWGTTVDLAAAGGGGQPYTYEPQYLPADPEWGSGFIDSNGWQYLGQEDFFVAAKLAIFEESFVKNTINVGNNGGSNAFANIVLAGGRVDPYIAVGQNATVGDDGDQTTTGVIGYNRPGVFLGTYDDATPLGGGNKTPRFSLVNTGATRYLRWDSNNLEIEATNFSLDEDGNVTVRGNIIVTDGNVPTTSSFNAATGALEQYISDTSSSIVTDVQASDAFLLNYVNETSGSLKQFADAVAFAASESAVGIATALTYALANGTLTGTANTFISEKFIYSPVIAGEEGVFNGKVAVAGGTMFLGNNVQGTNDGLYINSNNYWYNDGNFAVGGVGGSMTFDGASGSINLNNNFIVTSDGNLFANSGSFRGTVNATLGSLAGWTISETTLESAGGFISLIGTGSGIGIKVRDSNDEVKVNMNTDTSLPVPGAGTSITRNGSSTTIVESVSGNFQNDNDTVTTQIGTNFTITVAGTYDFTVNASGFARATGTGGDATAILSSNIFIKRVSDNATVGTISYGGVNATGYYAVGEALPTEENLTLGARSTTVSLDATSYYFQVSDLWSLSTFALPSGILGPLEARVDKNTSYTMAVSLAITGTTINGGGLQTVRDAENYFRFNAESVGTYHSVGDINGSSTIEVRTDLSGSLGVDMMYLKGNDLNNVTPTPGGSSQTSYTRLPNNVVMQFGYHSPGSVDGNSRTTITFPLTFTRVYSASVHTNRGDRGSLGANHINNLTTSTLDVVVDSSSGRCYWMAIGIIV